MRIQATGRQGARSASPWPAWTTLTTRQAGRSARAAFSPAARSVARSLGRTPPGAASARARHAAIGCAPERRKAVTLAKRGPSGPNFGNNAKLFCVRTDGGRRFTPEVSGAPSLTASRPLFRTSS